MTLQIAPPTATTGTPPRRLRVIATTAAALLTAALLAMGGWHVSREGSTSTSTTHSAPIGQPVRPAAVHADERIDRVPTTYLVESPEQAALTLKSIDEANAIREGVGESPLRDEVVLLASAAEEAVFWAGIHEADRPRESLGLPPMSVIDLRQPVGSTPAPDPAAFSDQELYARWVRVQAAQ